MGLSIINSIVWIILSAIILFSSSDAEIWILLQIVVGVLLFTAVIDLVVAVFILRLKKWAFNIYVVFTVINCVSSIISLNFFSALLRGGLTYLIFRHDYEHFN